MNDTVHNAYQVQIHIAGSRQNIERVCQEFCFDVGLCVTVKDQTFIYTGGQEIGCEIGLINYPRFPKSKLDIWNTAKRLAKELLAKTFQHSVLLMDNETVLWITHKSPSKET